MTGLLSGRIVVGMVTACTVAPLFDALAAFHLAHPGIEIALVEGNSDWLVEQVRTGAADVALIGAAGTAPEGLDALTIVSEGLVAAVPPGHPLAGREAVTLAEVTRYPIISLPPGTGVRAVFDQDCAAQGRRPDIAFQASAPGCGGRPGQPRAGRGYSHRDHGGRILRPADRGGHQGHRDHGAARPGLGARREPRPA